MVVLPNGYRRSCEYDMEHYSSEYMNHHHCDHECGGHDCGPHYPHHYPYYYHPQPNQPVVDNIFMVNEDNPYLVDGTQYRYGNVISFANDVDTRIVNKKGVSCVNLDAVFDLTDQITTNNAWARYVEQIISMKYDTLKEILPMIKSTIVFRLFYTIKDSSGEEIIRAYCDSPCQCGLIHPCGDLKDNFVSSYKNIFTDTLSSTPYSGLYTLTIEKVEAIIDTVNIASLIPPTGPNPYYAFSHNNTHIDVFHDALKPVEPTESFVIATCEVHKAFSIETNVMTKLKVSYVAYMNNCVLIPNTLGVWESLYNPSQYIIKELREDVNTLSTYVAELTEKVAILESVTPQVLEYDKKINIRKGNIVYLVLGSIYQAAETYVTTEDESVTVAEAFEADVLAGKLVKLDKYVPQPVHYAKNLSIGEGYLVYLETGKLYQAPAAFITNNDEEKTVNESFEADVTAGNIVPVTPVTTTNNDPDPDPGNNDPDPGTDPQDP